MFTIKILQNNQDRFRPTVIHCENEHIKAVIHILESDVNTVAYSVWEDGDVMSPFALDCFCKKIRRIIHQENGKICPRCFSDAIADEDYVFNALDPASRTSKPYVFRKTCNVCGKHFNLNNEIIEIKK